MQFNPARSWAVTYNQMWNLTMKEHLSKQNFKGNFTGNSGGTFGGSVGMRNRANIKSKPEYCWSFNRGQSCRFGRNCRFIERCSYCDSPSHGVYTCHKLKKKEAMMMANNLGGGGGGNFNAMQNAPEYNQNSFNPSYNAVGQQPVRKIVTQTGNNGNKQTGTGTQKPVIAAATNNK